MDVKIKEIGRIFMEIVHITNAFDEDIIPCFTGLKQMIISKINSKKWKDYFSSLKLLLLFDEEFMKDCNHKEIRFKVTLTTGISNDELQIGNVDEEIKVVKNDTDYILIQIIQNLKAHFIKEVIKIATNQNIANYFYSMYKRIHPGLKMQDFGIYKKLVLYNWNFGSDMHPFTTRHINLIFPMKKSLDADTIKDDTEGNIKVIITNSTSENLKDHYVGFDQIIGIND